MSEYIGKTDECILIAYICALRRELNDPSKYKLTLLEWMRRKQYLKRALRDLDKMQKKAVG